MTLYEALEAMTLYEALEAGKPIKWEQFKVCEGCNSILFASANRCPICHTYRFEESVDKVEAQARVNLKNTQNDEYTIPRYEF